ISGRAQDNVETAYLDEIRNLGYKPLVDRDEKRARSFFHMLRWVKSDPDRLRLAKTGWPRLKRYMRLGCTRSRSNARASLFGSAESSHVARNNLGSTSAVLTRETDLRLGLTKS